MRRLLEGLAGAAGAVLGLGFIVLQVGLYTGGVSYRKDCINAQGQITKSWTFTWLAPIPYLFRPDDPNCVIHTGSRVALNAVGIAKFADTTSTAIADQAVDRATPDGDTAYWVKLRGALNDYEARNAKIADIDGAQQSIDTLFGQLTALDPTARYGSAHAKLVAAVQTLQRDGRDMAAAARDGDQSAYQRLQEKAANGDGVKVKTAMDALNAAHGSG
jgi:hypothetical protein